MRALLLVLFLVGCGGGDDLPAENHPPDCTSAAESMFCSQTAKVQPVTVP